MYLLRKAYYDALNKKAVIEPGIKCLVDKNGLLMIPDSFWGTSEVWGNDTSRLIADGEYMLLPYTNEIQIKSENDGFKDILFNVSIYDENNIDGYVIFIPFANNIETNGEKLFGRYVEHEAIIILREHDYIKFDGQELVVENEKLYLRV